MNPTPPLIPPLLAFWPFASGWMLFWTAAAVLPIVIHLWNRRKYREVTWAAMEYLLAAMRKNSRRILVEQWVLLAVRTLILVLFAVALAEPLLSLVLALAGAFGGRGQTHWVIVMDVSYSMAATREGKTRFELAKELAAQTIEQSTQGDGFTLVALADVPRAIVRTPAFDPKDVLEELDALRVEHGGARLGPALAEIEQIVADAQEKHRRLVDTRICFFTDLGRTTWDDAATDAVGTRFKRLAEKATLAMSDVGDSQSQNVAVSRLQLPDSLVVLGREAAFEVELQNFGDAAISAQQVELWIDGRRTHVQTLALRPGGKIATTFRHRFELPGEHRLEARIAGDMLDVDNHRFLSLPVRESLNVLCVEGVAGEAKHLAIALEPAKSDRPLIRPVIVAESALLEKNLSEFDAVFLANVARISSDEAAVLSRYVRQGGGLVIFLGDEVQIDSYNQQLAADPAKRVLPARLESLSPTMSPGGYKFNPLEYQHPIVKPFASHPEAGLLTTPVYKYVKLVPVDAGASRVALGFDSGDPAALTEAIGRGMVVLVATAASDRSVDKSALPPTPWTAFSTWPSFPPLVQESLTFVTAPQRAERNVAVGDAIGGIVADASSQQALSVTTPDGRSERVQLKLGGDDASWSYDQTQTSGIYEARFGPPRDGTELFAVNVNARESDLVRIDPASLPEEFAREAETGAPKSSVFGGGSSAELFRWFLGGVLALLLTETVLAWRFGSGAR